MSHVVWSSGLTWVKLKGELARMLTCSCHIHVPGVRAPLEVSDLSRFVHIPDGQYGAVFVAGDLLSVANFMADCFGYLECR
jgi:hypothetical protein